MTLKLVATRIPEAQHRYLKQKSLDTGKPIQTILQDLINQYQADDTDYSEQLNQSVIESLNALASLGEQEGNHGL